MSKAEVKPAQGKETTFLVYLFGTLEYDGRAQRFAGVLGSLGRVCLIDVAGLQHDPAGAVSARRSVHIPAGAGVPRRHLRFWRIALAEAQRRRPRFVVAEDFYTTFPALLAALLTGAKLLYDAHELMIPERGQRQDWRYRIWYPLEKLAVRRAALVIAANEERARVMQRHYRLPQTPVVMQNFPPEREGAVDKAAILKRYPQFSRSSSEERLLLYQGNIHLTRGLDRFIQALASLPPRYRLIMAGGGPHLERLRSTGRPFVEAGRLVFLGPVENRILLELAAAADVGIVAYPFQGQNNIYCASNKVFEYLQAGIPVVSTDQPPLRRLVEDYNIGILIGKDDSPALVAEKLREVAENGSRYLEARSRFLRKHRWQDEAARVRAAIAALMG